MITKKSRGHVVCKMFEGEDEDEINRLMKELKNDKSGVETNIGF